jgi:hypothetical protein
VQGVLQRSYTTSMVQIEGLIAILDKQVIVTTLIVVSVEFSAPEITHLPDGTGLEGFPTWLFSPR